ncbi:hypothetical protein DN756_21685 (plasmid) [Yersinia pseudotuberculosis]|uniref:hypothetical protein n=1 Tax=Yersinia pseudotuberculosis TaxID=633 RepID=UPI000F4D482C|nr:hypothetical protein [Yersinia pseudotuberculosis]AYW98409.1 hypothetical protein EGX53_00170 [Yersinia pseudotuberculosis]AZA32608.1 hypothetical protein DN756_21685 [Yersinia pseudotuberculosis]
MNLQNNLYSILEKVESLKNIKMLDKNNGEFTYIEGNYYFSALTTDSLNIYEIKYLFTFENFDFFSNGKPNEVSVYKAINSFNSVCLGIKASLNSLDVERKELTVQFTYSMVFDASKGIPNFSNELETSMGLLRIAPKKLSNSFKDKGIEHNYVN